MKKIVIILLRIPFVILAVSVIYTVVKEPTVAGSFVAIGGSSLCFALWHTLGLLNGPSETFNQRFYKSNIKIFLYIAAACISIGTQV